MRTRPLRLKPTGGQVRAVIYRRISRDLTGEEAGVTRQNKDCLAFCAQRGWAVVANLEDNDLSASRYSRKKRPAYAEALRLIEHDEANAVVAYHLDRLWRQPKELEHLIDLVERKRVIVATLTGDISLETGEGRFSARTLVSVAAMEADNISRRTKRGKDENAVNGGPTGGPRPFGYNGSDPEHGVKGGKTLIPDEAEAVKDAVGRFLAGETLTAICQRWNDAGFRTTVHGRPFTLTIVRQILENPRIAGLRAHNGDIIGPASWPAIISESDHRQVVAMLADPSRKQAPRKRGLLTGFLRCGRCGLTLTRISAQSSKDRKRKPTYSCHHGSGGAGCFGVSVSADPVDALVVEAALLVFDDVDLSAPQSATVPSAGDDGAAALEGRMRELSGLWADGAISRTEWLTARKRIDGRLAAIKRQQTTPRSLVAMRYHGRPGMLRQKWPDLTLDEQRAVIGSVIDRVTVNPVAARGPRFDKNRLDITWRV